MRSASEIERTIINKIENAAKNEIIALSEKEFDEFAINGTLCPRHLKITMRPGNQCCIEGGVVNCKKCLKKYSGRK